MCPLACRGNSSWLQTEINRLKNWINRCQFTAVSKSPVRDDNSMPMPMSYKSVIKSSPTPTPPHHPPHHHHHHQNYFKFDFNITILCMGLKIYNIVIKNGMWNISYLKYVHYDKLKYIYSKFTSTPFSQSGRSLCGPLTWNPGPVPGKSYIWGTNSCYVIRMRCINLTNEITTTLMSHVRVSKSHMWDTNSCYVIQTSQCPLHMW